LECHEHKARSQLRHTIIRCIKEAPFRHVSELLKAIKYVLTITGKPRHAQATYVLEQQSLWSYKLHLFDRPREQVTLITSTELFTRDTKGRAGNSPREECNSFVLGRLPDLRVGNVTAPYDRAGKKIVTTLEVLRQGVSGVLVELDGQAVTEPCQLQPEDLTSGACTDLDYFKTWHHGLLVLLVCPAGWESWALSSLMNLPVERIERASRPCRAKTLATRERRPGQQALTLAP
jgi:hypothetical protein